MTSTGYKLVQLRAGLHSIQSLAYGETMHPAIGPAAEAVGLYVKQLHLVERVREHAGLFVIWDVGLGAAANALAVLRATRHLPCAIRLISFDDTTEPLRFALKHAKTLGYFDGNESRAETLLEKRRLKFRDARHRVDWELQTGDFPTLIARLAAAAPARSTEEPNPLILSLFPSGGEGGRGAAGILPPDQLKGSPAGKMPAAPWRRRLPSCRFMVPMHGKDDEAFHEPRPVGGPLSEPKRERTPAERLASLPAPHAILFDPFSPVKNPAMWTAPLFTNLFRLLDRARPCALATYSRSTMTRAGLLLAGFYVGAGQATGAKEETTLAANTLELIDQPLDRRWLERARRSHSAEPLREPIHASAPLSSVTWERLQAHPQFN